MVKNMSSGIYENYVICIKKHNYIYVAIYFYLHNVPHLRIQHHGTLINYILQMLVQLLNKTNEILTFSEHMNKIPRSRE